MGKNRPRRVVVEPAAPEDPAARLEVLEALLAGVNLPFGRRGETPVAGHKAVGENGDEPLPGGVDDAAAHHPGGVAAEAHAYRRYNFVSKTPMNLDRLAVNGYAFDETGEQGAPFISVATSEALSVAVQS